MTPEQLEKIRKLCDKNFKVGIFPKTISRDELLYLGGCAGGMIDLIDKQEKEIKRLEAENYQWRSYNHELGNKSHKQRLALKKLGEKVRARGNALVEERARGNHYGISYEEMMAALDNMDEKMERWIIGGEKDMPKRYLDIMRSEARRQLRAEGVIG